MDIRKIGDGKIFEYDKKKKKIEYAINEHKKILR
jgi:hypothetical protein